MTNLFKKRKQFFDDNQIKIFNIIKHLQNLRNVSNEIRFYFEHHEKIQIYLNKLKIEQHYLQIENNKLIKKSTKFKKKIQKLQKSKYKLKKKIKNQNNKKIYVKKIKIFSKYNELIFNF